MPREAKIVAVHHTAACAMTRSPGVKGRLMLTCQRLLVFYDAMVQVESGRSDEIG